MVDIKNNLTKQQQINLENANRWLRRANLDFNAFRRIAPFENKSHKPIHCSDPAIAVYLLQQSIEKATKAVAAATGKFSDQRLRSHHHNSLDVLLSFYGDVLNTMAGNTALNGIGKGLGMDLPGGLDKISNLKTELNKTPEQRKPNEVLNNEQFATATSEQIDNLLNVLLNLRTNAFIGIPKSVFGPHGKIVIDAQKLDYSNPSNFVSSVIKELKEKLNIPKSSETEIKLLEQLVELYCPNGIINDSNQNKIIIERPTSDQLGHWSMAALLILAMYTFPHESTSRYPRKGKKANIPGPQGYEDYDNNLGIVNQLGRMGYVAMLALNEIIPELESIAAFYPVTESKLAKFSINR